MKHIFLTAALLAGWAGAHPLLAQVENFLGPPMQLNGIYSGSNVSPVLLDMDGDGDLDIIRSAWESSDLVWHRNEGGGLWSQEIMLMSNLPNLHRVEAHDFNNDGLLDLGLLTYNEHRLYAAMGTDVGQFSDPTPITGSFSEAIDFTAGDFDGDGDLDMVEIDRGYGEVVLYTFEESGFNPNPMMMGNLYRPTRGESADVDGDGRDEFLIAPYSDADRGIWLFDWTEEGGWESTRIYTGYYFDRMILLDFDADGDLDVLTDDQQTVVFLEQTDSVWTAHPLFVNSNQIHDFELLGSPSDWQIYVNSWDSDNIKRYETNEEGLWESEVALEIIDCRDFQWMDDGGELAMVTREAFGGQVAVRRNLEDLAAAELVNNNNINTPWYTKWAQLDSDPELEIVVASSGTNQIYWFDYNGNENWGNPKLLSNLVINPHYVDPADVDGDGDDDILVVGRSENRIAWIENLGNGEFSGLNTITVILDDPEVAKWLDIDGDGDLDVIATSEADRRFVVFENQGGQNYAAGVDLVTPHTDWGPVDFDAQDIDGDGFPEILVSWYYEVGWVDVFEGMQFEYTMLGRNNSAGESRVGRVHGAGWAQADGDGFWDAVIANEDWGAIACYRGRSEGGFAEGEWLASRNPNRFDPNHQKYSLSVSDVDNDGLSDLVYNKLYEEGLRLMHFDASGAAREAFDVLEDFQLENTNASRNFRHSDWKDWDGDGDPDLVTSHPWNDWILVQENKQELLGCTNPEACNYDASAEFDNGKCKVVGETCNDGVSATYDDVIQPDCTCGGTSFNGEIAHRINSGYTAGEWTDQEGNVWSPEAHTVGGGNTSTGVGVNETADDSLYRWVRYSLTGYDLPVEAGGTYLVRLHFACIRGEVNQEGFQVFDVEIEGQTIYDNLDLFAVNGGERYKRFIVEEIVSTEDEILEIRFPMESWQNEVSAVEVFAYTGDCMDIDADGVCDDLEVEGCTYPPACNYDPEATENDGSCDFVTCAGCMDETACNFDPEATFADASCTFPEPEYDCDGNCLSDIDGDEVCDAFEVNGCTYVTATNYNPSATNDDGTCVFDGISEILGCTYPDACNYDANAILDDGSCTFAPIGYTCDGDCIADSDGDGVCDEYEGCTIEEACNYNPMAQDNSGCCIFADPGADCDGNCLADTDGDGVCDANELAGCMDELACNYSPLATDESGFCIYPAPGADCEGNCEADTDGDGVCDAQEVAGCMDGLACNYDETATDADGSCVYPPAYVDCDGVCLQDFDGDGVCDALEVPGCIYAEAANFNIDATEDDGSCLFTEDAANPGCFYSAACNYDPAATSDDGSCSFPAAGYDCDGVCLNDCDGDGVCDDFEITGCTDAAACNFDPEATDSVDNCEFVSCAGCADESACNFDPEALIETNELCEFESCAGCMDATACNFDPVASIADLSCDYATCAGCTYPIASNYDPDATIDDGSCEFISSELCNGCMGDLNNNLQVDTGDLLLLLTVFSSDCPSPSEGE